jgi:proteasome lid subunit RPN8/RPN11
MISSATITLRRTLVEEMYAHARASSPEECCGLVGGQKGLSQTIYRLRNIARARLVAYEAAPEDLFAAQRRMRECGEELLGIYHSHPRASEPEPSQTDVRLAYYPSAIYFIIGFTDAGEGVLRAFRVSEREGSWERVPVELAVD